MEELDNRYGDFTAVAISKTKNKYEDAACKRGVGSLINQGTSTGVTRFNCQLIVGGRRKDKVIVKALRNIKNGQELYTNYGSEYLFDEDTRYTTK